MLQGISLSVTVKSYWIFFSNHIVISHVHVQQNVRRTKGAPCLRCRTNIAIRTQ